MGSTPAVLVGDVGATSLRLALVDRATETRLRELTTPSRGCSGLVEPALSMLREASCPVREAVLAVAGPVVEGRAELTNLGWSLNEGELAAEPARRRSRGPGSPVAVREQGTTVRSGRTGAVVVPANVGLAGAIRYALSASPVQSAPGLVA